MHGQAMTPRGEGRGPFTQDGCAVELYRRFPYRGEVEILSGVLAEAGFGGAEWIDASWGAACITA
jgi:hypothetical protein